MCESLDEWLDKYALGPSPGRRSNTRSVKLTDQEAEIIDRVAHDPRMRALVDGSFSELARLALVRFATEAAEMLALSKEPLVQSLRAHLEHFGLGMREAAINEYVTNRGKEMLMLVDQMDEEGAFAVYEETIDFFCQRGPSFAGLLSRRFHANPDVRQALDRLVKQGGTAAHERLRVISSRLG